MNVTTVNPKQIETQTGKIQIFTQYTIPVPENTMKTHAETYREGFNNEPWDVYGWDMSPGKAESEFSKLISVVLKTGGALLSLEHEGIAAGFCIVTDMNIFIQRQLQIEKFKRLPKDYINPGQYLETIRKEIRINASDWSTVGYLADLVISKSFRGRNLGKTLVNASLDYLETASDKHFALGWSVNPVMSNILQSSGFKRINGVGSKGEGIDFLVQGKVWYPSLDLPVEEKSKSRMKPISAEHYLKDLKTKNAISY